MAGRFGAVKKGDLYGTRRCSLPPSGTSRMRFGSGTGSPGTDADRTRLPRNGAKSRRAGVRAPITATKPGNAGGAKGCRKVDAA